MPSSPQVPYSFDASLPPFLPIEGYVLNRAMAPSIRQMETLHILTLRFASPSNYEVDSIPLTVS